MLKLLSLLGLCCFLAIAWAISNNRKKFPWRVVLSGLGLQFVFGILILKTTAGKKLFEWAHTAANEFLGVANEGALMVFGPLADGEMVSGAFPDRPVVLAITITATIILVSAVSSLLYHWGLLQRVVQSFAWIMQRVMKLSGSESLAAAGNVFMGQTEAPLLVKPYLNKMTQSEMMALMTGGMATIAGGVLAVYVGFGINAGHLLTASVMSAPAALLIAKIIIPETETSPTAAGSSAAVERTGTNSLDALCKGASEGMLLSINVVAMLIGFTAIIALANLLLGWPQTWFGAEEPVTLQILLGWVNAPFAFLMGVPAQDCVAIGQVLGERIVLNEFIGYISLSGLSETLQPRSHILATYALCGFANFASIAIQLGGIGTLVPDRRKDLAKLGVRAMIGGVLASYLTATMVGILI
jgi:CNT family concentrative nucleoside transporter